MTKHLKLTSVSKVKYGRTLFQLEIAIECKWGKVGDKAGWVEDEKSLKDSFFENMGWISPEAEIWGGVIRGGEIWGGEIRGGVIWGGVIRGGVIRGGVIWGGEIRGGVIWGGEINKTLLQIQGSMHFINICDVGKIQIGCICKTFKEWTSQFKGIGKERAYSSAQIKEYGGYIKLMISWSKANKDAIKKQK